MFRDELKEKMQKIFGMSKTTFAAPGSFEQDTLFIQVDRCRAKPAKGKCTAEVYGSIIVFAKDDSMPYGFFAKRINRAGAQLTKDLFFYEVDTDVQSSPARIQNISERRCQFLYLYKEAYDPPKGPMEGIDDITPVAFLDTEEDRILNVGDGQKLEIDV